mgnify:CR=1 FL=1
MSADELLKSKIEEYYFNEYYRVLVIEDEEGYVVSVDVYKNSWKYEDAESICVENTCLLLKKIKGNPTSNITGVKEVIVIGARVGSSLETINVKWLLDHKPSLEEVRAIYESSWQLISQ